MYQGAAVQLIIMIGLPGSGKSTAAAAIAQTWPTFSVISTDRIRASQFGHEAIQGTWAVVWQEVQREFADTVRQGQGGQRQGAIYDATNVQRSQRRAVLTQARHSGFTDLIGVWLDVPLAECLYRNQARSRQVPELVVQRMQRQLQGAPPSPNEGMSRLYRYAPDRGMIEVMWAAAPPGVSPLLLPFGFPNLVQPLLGLS